MYSREFTGLPEYGMQLAASILKAQRAQDISLELTGHLPFLQQAPVSRLSSIDTIGVSCKTELKKNRDKETLKTQVGVETHHLTACPCTLSYNETLFNRINDPYPQATHSQRSRTRLLVSLPGEQVFPAYHDLAAILAGVLHLSHDLLKRPDETELVLKAHSHPQFVEDTVREVARAAGEKLKDVLPAETRIQVHSRSLESIHIHDVECFLDITLGDILTTLRSMKKVQSQ